ncbi:hypothetical protein [Flammeovirga kamogawensis]|uniref:Uncharacterized protein n=1 Tax=Flammeovirga kamogawensis TaxID=373891 RepID=A0ABX8H2W2_9BACT|nr:hypothetical protein [Flammeovirga kamogawensis]QWG09902.1 hypothetical protein KM029_19670 [Flammeovirga kamogawensis]TRX65406.1 hypothetical protein EO216_23065 [Flammeovirga kamogawensis]
MKLLRLKDGNQSEVIFSSKNENGALESIDFSWNTYDFDDNPYSRLIEFIDDNSNTPSSFKNKNDLNDYWLKLNRPQKVIWLFGILQTYVYSVSIDEFIYDFYYLIHAVTDIFEELKLEKEQISFHQRLLCFMCDEVNQQFIQENIKVIRPEILEKHEDIKTKNHEFLDEDNMKQIHQVLFNYILTNKKYFFQ